MRNYCPYTNRFKTRESVASGDAQLRPQVPSAKSHLCFHAAIFAHGLKYTVIR